MMTQTKGIDEMGSDYFDEARMAVSALSAVDKDNFIELVILSVLYSRGAVSKDTCVPEDEMDRIVKWYMEFKMGVSLLNMVLLGLVEIHFPSGQDEPSFCRSKTREAVEAVTAIPGDDRWTG